MSTWRCGRLWAQLQRKLFEIIVFSISLSIDECKRGTIVAATAVPGTDARKHGSDYERLGTLACQVLAMWCVPYTELCPWELRSPWLNASESALTAAAVVRQELLDSSR